MAVILLARRWTPTVGSARACRARSPSVPKAPASSDQMLQADRNRTERTGTRRRAALRQAIAVSTVARIRLRCCVQLSSAVVERAFSQPDVSRFRAEADENSDHPCQHSGNSGERPIVIVVHSLADSSLKRRIIGSQQIAELMGHAGKRRPDARWRQFVQMRRDDAPGSLDANLHQEAGDPESERGAAKCQNGRTGSDSSAAMTLVTRRPMRSESAPNRMPPTTAPAL